MKKINLAIVGATGVVGRSVVEVLIQRGLIKHICLTLFVSERSANKKLEIGSMCFDLFDLNSKKSNLKFDYVIFSAGDDISKLWAYHFVQRGAVVIDNSNAFRRVSHIPLVVPEINGEMINENSRLISNPNCSTIQLVLVLNELKKICKIKKVYVSTYQSVSGAGAKALLDLKNKTSFEIKPGIFDNAIAEIGSKNEAGYTSEEDKIMFETKKILKFDFEIFSSAVRIPISYCHLESVFVEFEDEFDIKKVKNLSNDWLEISDETILPTAISGTDKTYAFRFRKTSKNGLAFFVLADNVRRGASFNAIKILEMCLSIKGFRA